ncbi:MAG: Glu/Leu/Phe/Val dehydrogenase dimerization domain-containing protein, partial [Patescibacteria group bacterium]
MISNKHLGNIEDFPEFDNHEEVLFFSDKKSGLRSFIAIHSTVLGPATGGTRCFHYRSELDALKDALRLSRSMTYKCALARVPFGGGKGVILLRADQKKTSALIAAYAKKVNTLDGRFSTGEDVGLTEHDVSVMEKVSPYINGPRASGELGSWAALGVFMAMKSALKELFDSSSFEYRTFAIKGVGKVGSELCDLINKNGGQIVVADIDPAVIKRIKKNYPGIKIVSPRTIHRERVDVYAPCAMGN